ncbi:MAG: DNA mismatch repair endonuclease MutL [Gammaproteobacteria bacterium]
MTKIHILPPLLANQIAAGEVVERPASVVKEVVENSLDAGARSIWVDVESGGHRLLRVRDDGAGIAQDELPLAVQRHATSKLQSLDDLSQIGTLGFRGEALASISAVSRFSITSRQADTEAGWSIRCEGTHVELQESPAAHPVGTTVEVRDLFFNTPARRHFLKKERTEFTHIEQLLKQLALCHVEVAFTLTHNGKDVFRLRPAMNPADQQRRLSTLLGSDFAAQALRIDVEREPFALRGWIGLPAQARAQADQQYFFVNNRAIRDKLVSHAIRAAYADVLHHGRQAVFALSLTLPVEWVDVNVHPTKQEVRFRNSRDVHGFITSVLRRALADVRPAEQMQQQVAFEQVSEPISEHMSEQIPEQQAMHAVSDVETLGEPLQMTPQPLGLDIPATGLPSMGSSRTDWLARSGGQMRAGGAGSGGRAPGAAVSRVTGASDLSVPDDPFGLGSPSWDVPASLKTTGGAVQGEDGLPVGELSKIPPTDIPPLGFALAQLNGVYILSHSAEGLIVVDMHAAHERIGYERLKQQYGAGNLAQQRLLVPIVLTVSEPEATCAVEQAERFAEFGFEVVRRGPETVEILSMPAILLGADVSALIKDVLADVMVFDESDRLEHSVNQVLATLSCHAAVRANDHLTLPEMNQILRDLESVERGGQCNHGRPTWVLKTWRDLDHWFWRGQ